MSALAAELAGTDRGYRRLNRRAKVLMEQLGKNLLRNWLPGSPRARLRACLRLAGFCVGFDGCIDFSQDSGFDFMPSTDSFGAVMATRSALDLLPAIKKLNHRLI